MKKKKTYSGMVWFDTKNGVVYQRRRRKGGGLYWKKFKPCSC